MAPGVSWRPAENSDNVVDVAFPAVLAVAGVLDAEAEAGLGTGAAPGELLSANSGARIAVKSAQALARSRKLLSIHAKRTLATCMLYSTQRWTKTDRVAEHWEGVSSAQACSV